jgi:hypothetical protein
VGIHERARWKHRTLVATVWSNEPPYGADLNCGGSLPGDGSSGTMQLDDAAARLGIVDDPVIVMSYAEYDETEYVNHRLLVVHVDARNRLASTAPQNAATNSSPT